MGKKVRFHNHQRRSFPADKHIPIGIMQVVSAGGRKVVKHLHAKKARTYSDPEVN